MMYFYCSSDVEQSYEKAFEHFKGAARGSPNKKPEYLGPPIALNSTDEAILRWPSPYSVGHWKSSMMLSQMYEKGLGVEANPKKARKWFKRSERQRKEAERKAVKVLASRPRTR